MFHDGYEKSRIRWFHEPLRGVFEKPAWGPELVMGLEFENELPHPCDMPKVAGWTMHHENSLRDFGYEYVSTKPVIDTTLRKQVVMLFKKIEEVCAQVKKESEFPYKPSNSIRTSVHIHLDAGELTYIQMLNFALVYWLLEDFLSTYCGQTRKGNLFCLRLKDASYQKYCLLSELQSKMPYSSNIFSEGNRYASLNLAAIRKFGSLESRLMRGTTNTQEVFTWMDAMLAIYKFSLSGIKSENGQFITPKDIQKDFLLSCDASEYPARVLGPALFDRMKTLCKAPIFESEVAAGVRANYINMVDIFNASETFDFSKEAKEQEEELKKSAASLAKKYTGFAPTSTVSDDPVVWGNGLSNSAPPPPKPFSHNDDQWTEETPPVFISNEIGDL